MYIIHFGYRTENNFIKLICVRQIQLFYAMTCNYCGEHRKTPRPSFAPIKKLCMLILHTPGMMGMVIGDFGHEKHDESINV